MSRAPAFPCSVPVHSRRPAARPRRRAPHAPIDSAVTPEVEIKLLHHDLWQRADWQGVTYLMNQTADEPPRLALNFNNGAAGAAAFEDLVARIGRNDPEGLLRITFIEGEVPGMLNPAYTLMLGPEVSKALPAVEARVGDAPTTNVKAFVVRIRPPTTPALARFKALYTRHGECLILPAQRGGTPDPHHPLGIWKRNLHFRSALEISKDRWDPDAVALLP